MKSIPTAVALGFLAMIFLRLLLDDRDYWGPERKREPEYVFIVSFLLHC
ncbi:MAG TPA: hypothetical protein GX711_04835 [Clostridia bacterium]|nr:hypothetical protein [Clostridia bacterium]